MSESFAYGASEDPDRNDYFSKLRIQSSQRMQRLLDRSVPFAFHRWLLWVFLALMYTLRAYFVHGYYIVTYGLGIYNLNLMIGFLSPARDPSLSASEGPTLPSSNNEEYRYVLGKSFELRHRFTNAFEGEKEHRVRGFVHRLFLGFLLLFRFVAFSR